MQELIIQEIPGPVAAELSEKFAQALPGRLSKLALHINSELGLKLTHFSAQYKGEPIGLVTGKQVQALYGYIDSIGVLPDYQRQGVGSQLLNAMCDRLNEAGAKVVSFSLPASSVDISDHVISQIVPFFHKKNGFIPYFDPYEYGGRCWIKVLDTPLHKLVAMDRDAREFGFDFPNFTTIAEAVVSECQEVREAFQQGESPERVQEELGDLLHVVVAMCLFTGFDVEQTLSLVHKKFGKRMEALKKEVYASGLNNLQGQSNAHMMAMWRKVKQNLASSSNHD